MLGRGRAGRRLDDLRRRFEPRGSSSLARSASVGEAADRLAIAVERHVARLQRARDRADRLIGALEVIPQGVVLADASGRIVFRNRAASGFHAARHGEALVESAISELIAEAVAGEPGTRTLELYGPPRRALQLRAVPLAGVEGTDDPTGAFLIVEDVSERQRLDAVRRDFVANISHELKTPIGALGLLAETMVGETDPQVAQRLARRMHEEAFRVARTVDDLLHLSQLEGSEPPSHEMVALDTIVAQAVDRSRHAAEQRGVTVVVREPDEPVAVVGDQRQLVSALTNLCDNAVKYSDRGDEVELCTRRSGGWAEIDVVDHGIGIPAADLERVFERFYRVDRARSRETGGTGLGLAIVRHVVNNHRGEVSVRSHEGEGTTFTLRLPAAPTTGPGSAGLDADPDVD